MTRVAAAEMRREYAERSKATQVYGLRHSMRVSAASARHRVRGNAEAPQRPGCPVTGRRKDFADPPSEAMRSRGQTEPLGVRSAVLGRKRECATERSRKGALVIPPGRRRSRRREGIPPGERVEDGGEALGRDFSIFRFFDSSIELGQ